MTRSKQKRRVYTSIYYLNFLLIFIAYKKVLPVQNKIKFFFLEKRNALRDYTDILARTPGRRASDQCTIGLTGVVCVLLTWPWTGSGHSFFLPSSRPFFTRPFPPLRGLRTDIARCDVTRGGVIGSTHVLLSRVGAPGVYLLRNPSNPFLRIAQRSESRLFSQKETDTFVS